jgi:hypothetical protein
MPISPRFGNQVSDVPRLDAGELLGVLLDQRCEPPKKAASIGR